jgi:hypothetical protein
LIDSKLEKLVLKKFGKVEIRSFWKFFSKNLKK